MYLDGNVYRLTNNGFDRALQALHAATNTIQETVVQTNLDLTFLLEGNKKEMRAFFDEQANLNEKFRTEQREVMASLLDQVALVMNRKEDTNHINVGGRRQVSPDRQHMPKEDNTVYTNRSDVSVQYGEDNIWRSTIEKMNPHSHTSNVQGGSTNRLALGMRMKPPAKNSEARKSGERPKRGDWITAKDFACK